MNAAYYEGDSTLRLGKSEVVKPGPEDVCIKVSYCGICGTDLHIYAGHMDKRVSMPHIMGHEMSGIIAEVGSEVQTWKTGDRVVVRPLDPCNNCPACEAGFSHICQNLKFLGIDTPGALQSYWTVPAHTLHRLPPEVDLKFGALIEPLSVACHDVRIGEVTKGDYAVVIGGGPIGLLIALVAKLSGAQVVVSEVNPFRLQFAGELGLDVVNPDEVDMQECIEDKTRKAGADVVFEVSASEAGAEMMTNLVRTRGRIVIVGIFSKMVKVDLFRVFWRELKFFGARVYEAQDFEEAINLCKEGTLPLEKIITSVYSLPELPAAFTTLAGSKNSMKTMIKVG